MNVGQGILDILAAIWIGFCVVAWVLVRFFNYGNHAPLYVTLLAAILMMPSFVWFWYRYQHKSEPMNSREKFWYALALALIALGAVFGNYALT